MSAVRRFLRRPIGKILAIPILLVSLLVAVVVAISVDDLTRGGDCQSAAFDKSAVVFDAVVVCGTSDVAQGDGDVSSRGSTLSEAHPENIIAGNG